MLNSGRRVVYFTCITFGVAYHISWCFQMNLKDMRVPAFIEPEALLLNLSLNYHSCVNNTQVPLNWCIDNEFRTPRFVGTDDVRPPKTIQRYSHKGYEACLGEKVVVFIGDSRVRYQFLNLAAYLKYRKFMRCGDYPSGYDKDETCFLIDESEMETWDWTRWYQESTKGVQDTPDQESLCDCYRPKRFSAEQTVENRYIHRKTQFGDIKLVYLQSFRNSIQIDKKFPPFSDSYFPNDSQCRVGECGKKNRTNAFEGNLNKTLWKGLPKLKATHAFVHVGWDDLPSVLSLLSCMLEEFQLQHPDIRVFLISHPYSYKAGSVTFDPRDLKCKCNVLDRFAMSKNAPRSWYWDKMHSLSILNEEFNHQLIEKICPISSM